MQSESDVRDCISLFDLQIPRAGNMFSGGSSDS